MLCTWIKRRNTPKFVIADHTRDKFSHCHIAIETGSNTDNSRSAGRVIVFHGLSNLEAIHFKRKQHTVGDFHQNLLYLGKDGCNTSTCNGKGMYEIKMLVD